MSETEREAALAEAINKIKSERLTTKVVLHFKEGQLVGGSFSELPFMK